MANAFGQPEPQENVKPEGNSSVITIILLIIIIVGGGVLAYLLYKQSQEPPIVLDEVVETIDLPTTVPDSQNQSATTPVVPTSPSE